MAKYTIRIQRNNVQPDGSIDSRFDDFEVDALPKITLLIVLELIRGRMDGSVTYRMSCRSAICGSCAMKMDGKTRLACKTHLEDVVEEGGVLTLTPMGNQPILKDLAVDIGPFFKKVHHIKPYLQKGPEAEKRVHQDSFDQVNNVSQCIMCGTCYSDCTMSEVSEDYLGPAALAKAFRFVSDPREGQKTARLKALANEASSMWSCVHCTMCVEMCPKSVAPMDAIVKLRARSIEKGFVDSDGARHALCFHKDIVSGGDLNEFTLLQRTVGLLGTIGEMGTALHLMKKGKIPSPFPHKAEGLDEVQKMYRILEENPIETESVTEAGEPA